MLNAASKRLLLIAFLSFAGNADSGAIDPADSSAVRGILDAVGWKDVPVDSVVDKNQILASNTARVTGLNLAYKTNLPKIARLPSMLKKLPELVSLNLAGNALSELPPELADLKKLRKLNISSNAFTALPDSSGNVPLEVLDASFNHITSFPSFAGSGSTLTILNLRANRISVIPPQIQSLVRVTDLNLIANRIELLPPEIASLASLKMLGLDSNELSTLPPKITALQQVRIGVTSNRICTLSDYSIIAWLNAHHLTPEWRATERCDDSGYAAIATDLATGTIVSFTSAYTPSANELSVAKAVSVESASKSNIPFPSTVTGGKTVLKAVTITVSPVFKTKVNTFHITMSFGEPALSAIDPSGLSIYFYDGTKWQFFGGAVNAGKKTISVKSGKEGTYALLYDGGKVSSARGALPARLFSFFRITKSPPALMLTFGHRPSSGISVSFLTLAGRLLSRVAVEKAEANQAIAVTIPAALSGKPGIVAVSDGKETVTRLIVLP